MKTHLFSVLLLCLSSVAAVAQGSIVVGNGIAATRFPIYGLAPIGSPVVGNSDLSQPSGTTVYVSSLLSGTRYVIEFWAGPASATDFSGLTLITTTTFRTGANPDALPNGITTTTSAVIPGVLPGSQAKLAVRVWDTQGGTSFANAWFKGQGALFTSGPLGGAAPDNNVYLPPNWVGQSFAIVMAIPEPSSLALAGLGAASLLIFRRRK